MATTGKRTWSLLFGDWLGGGEDMFGMLPFGWIVARSAGP